MESPDPTTAIIGAMPEEIAELLADLEEGVEQRRAGHRFRRGRLDGHRVILAECGVGKVNAASLAQALVLEGVARVLFTGVAGAVDPSLRVGDIVVATDTVQHDVDVTGLGYELGTVPGEPAAWATDKGLVRLAVAAAAGLGGVRVVEGRVASGDQFIASVERVREIRRQFGAACVEMEGAAVAQVCARAGLPFVIVRSMSDTADGSAEVSFREFTPLAARHAKRVIRGILAGLER